MIKNPIRLLIAILLCQLVGNAASLLIAPSITSWYSTISAPHMTPPSWIFPPLWIVLYTLMGASLYLVWESSGKSKNVESLVQTFSIQLILNPIWALAFFALRLPAWGLVAAAGLWIAIAITITRFRQVSNRAAWLLAPYIAWITFAFVLNLYILLFG